MEAPHRFETRPTRVSAALGLLVIVGLLAGCAGPTSVADRVVQGLPDSLSETERAELELGPPDGEPVGVVWIEEGVRFAVVTLGSSSCPWVVTKLEATSAAALHVNLELSGGQACTDDLVAITHELTLPASVISRPVAVSITYSNWNSVTEVRLE